MGKENYDQRNKYGSDPNNDPNEPDSVLPDFFSLNKWNIKRKLIGGAAAFVLVTNIYSCSRTGDFLKEGYSEDEIREGARLVYCGDDEDDCTDLESMEWLLLRPGLEARLAMIDEGE